MDAPCVLIRLAEIYRNYAECEYNLGHNEGARFLDMRRWKRMDEEYAEPVFGYEVKKFADGHKEYKPDLNIDRREWKDDKFYWVPISRAELRKSSYLDALPYE